MQWQDGPPKEPGLFVVPIYGTLRCVRIEQVAIDMTTRADVGKVVNSVLTAEFIDLPEQLASSAVWRVERHLAIPETPT